MERKQNFFLHHFPSPRFLKTPAVGFEVSEEAIRFIELKEHASGFEVARFDEVRLPATEGEADFLEGKRLKGMAEEFCSKNKLGLIRAALPDEKAYIFKLDLPTVTDSREARSAVELRLEEFVPVPPKEAIFDFEIIDHSSADHTNLNVSVLPRMVVSKYLEFFKSLGLKPVALEVAAQATARAVIKEGDDTGTIVVNFGSQKTSFHLVHSGVVHFSSSISVGGDSMTQAIMKSMSVSLADAESIKKEKGVVKDKSNSDLFFSLLNSLSSMKDEITKLIEYWKTHKERYTEHKEDIERVVVCGREAPLRGLAEYLEASSGVPTALADVWTNVASLDKYIPPISQAESLAYATVIGLALGQYTKP